MDAEKAYTVLGVEPGASPKEVQLAYRKKALECHPDRASSAEEAEYLQGKFLQVRDAYEFLRRAGFPVPEPEKVVDVPAEGWAAGRSFAPRREPEDVGQIEKLGLGFKVRNETIVIWGILIPSGAVGIFYFLRLLRRFLAPEG